MAYSNLYLHKKTDYVPFVLAVIISVLLSVVVATNRKPTGLSRKTNEKPVRYEIVNLSANQAGIFWESDKKETGWIELLGQNGQVEKIYDERDLTKGKTQYIYHFALLRNLKENTQYRFQIANQRGGYGSDNGLLQLKTPKSGTRKYDVKPAYGKIIKPNGKPAEDVLVLLKIEGKIPVMALAKGTGEWLYPLHTLVEKKSGKVAQDLPDSLRVEAEFMMEEQQSSHIVSTLAGINPLATTIVMGRNYNLIAKAGQVLAVSTQEGAQVQKTLSVVYPRENALIPASKPLIKGQGVPGSDVLVFINSKPQFSYRTAVDSKGEWRVLPDNPIGAGSYTVTVTSNDEKGSKVTIRRNFMIAKNGEQVLGEATGSPTTVPTSPPVPTAPLTSPTPGGSTTPTVAPTPTTGSLPSPTLAATPTFAPVYPTEAPTAEPPRTGTNLLPFLLMSISFVIVGAGMMLVF